MFIEKRKVGKRTKYYLIHSYRVGKKVEKIRRFLGSDLSGKKLEKMRPIAEKQIRQRVAAHMSIRDPLLGAVSKSELKIIDGLKEKYDFRVFHLSKKEWGRFTELFTYNTNAIEGSELTQREVELVLEEDVRPRGKSEKDIAEAYGVDQAIEYIRKKKPAITIKLMEKLHHMVFKDTKEFAGTFRKIGDEAVVRDYTGRIVHHGAPSTSVQTLLKELVQWYDINKKKYLPIVLATVIHNQFENIHPFEDGNGRVGRLLLNNALLRHNMPPVNIDLTKRDEYYASLKEYSDKHNLRPTIELVLSEYRVLRKKLKKR